MQTIRFQILSEVFQVVFILSAKMCITLSHRRLCELWVGFGSHTFVETSHFFAHNI